MLRNLTKRHLLLDDTYGDFYAIPPGGVLRYCDSYNIHEIEEDEMDKEIKYSMSCHECDWEKSGKASYRDAFKKARKCKKCGSNNVSLIVNPPEIIGETK